MNRNEQKYKPSGGSTSITGNDFSRSDSICLSSLQWGEPFGGVVAIFIVGMFFSLWWNCGSHDTFNDKERERESTKASLHVLAERDERKNE